LFNVIPTCTTFFYLKRIPFLLQQNQLQTDHHKSDIFM